MIIVLDTSAAVEVVLDRPKAPAILPGLQDAEWVIAPDIFISEASNVFWKYHSFEDMPIDDSSDLLKKAIQLVDDFTQSIDLFLEAFSLSCTCSHPVYDTLFLVLARRYNARLCSIDKKLISVAAKNSIMTI